ncbi:MAG: PhoH family protein [Candidatus Omnitrophota bacterium]|nr:PhoH family protein [Candidatus Omnitrophota bacterium]
MYNISMRKIFVLDTNVIIHNADAINVFADNEVVLPIDVIEELDIFKKDSDEKGRNARAAIRMLDDLRERGKLGEGVPLENGGVLRIIMHHPDTKGLLNIAPNERDNRILMVAYDLQQKGNKVVFVSKDINARVKADALGIKAVDFEKQKVDIETLYSGWKEIMVSSREVDTFYERKFFNVKENGMFPNQYVLLKDSASDKHTALGRFDVKQKGVVPLKSDQGDVWGIKPRNKEQAIALDLLLDDNIKLVTLVGVAGTGKTLLALAAGLKKTVDEHAYKRILVSRPVIPMGKDIGYLPGTKEEKLVNWMQPIFDNLEYILTIRKRKEHVDDLIESDLLQLEALTYMRGRSIPNQFIIIDEAQNLTPHEIKTVVSRAGNNTKMVLTGDPYQIDSPYLDSSSNGLSYAVERMKGQEMFGHVTLTKNERSGLASVAAELL